MQLGQRPPPPPPPHPHYFLRIVLPSFLLQIQTRIVFVPCENKSNFRFHEKDIILSSLRLTLTKRLFNIKP